MSSKCILLLPITYSLLPNHPYRGSPISKLLEIEGQSNDAALCTADTSGVFDEVFILELVDIAFLKTVSEGIHKLQFRT